MTTAERILTINEQETYTQCAVIEAECREMAVRTDAANCYDRVFHFYDGSAIKKTHDGYFIASEIKMAMMYYQVTFADGSAVSLYALDKEEAQERAIQELEAHNMPIYEILSIRLV